MSNAHCFEDVAAATTMVEVRDNLVEAFRAIIRITITNNNDNDNNTSQNK